ncbi:MAG: heavy metal translocating P-type ATPase, partial [Candidatus Kapaibacterium sp.]
MIRAPKSYSAEILSKDSLSETYCAHCGDVCSGTSVMFEGKPFCCTGCRAVYEMLSGLDLCEYYNQDDRAGISMKRTSHLDFEILDDPDVARKLLSFTSRAMNRIAWRVPALHCASCVWLLEQLDRMEPGVLSSAVDMMRKTVTVDYNPEVTSLRKIAERMSRVGYTPLLRLEGTSAHDFKATRGLYTRLGIAGFAAANTMLAYLARYLAAPRGLEPSISTAFNIISVTLSIPVLLYCASPWFVQARAALRERKLTLDVPVALGIAVLFSRSLLDLGLGNGVGYLDSFNGLVFFLLIGRLFQQKAFDALSFDRTYRSFFPLSVRIEKNEESKTIPIEQVKIGDTLTVRNGEVIPCDSVLKSEIGYIDYSFVTGESMPVECTADQIVNAGGRIVGRATRLIAIKTVSQSDLASMWERSSARPGRSQLLRLSDLFGKWFTIGALGIAIIAGLAWLPNVGIAFNVFTAVLIVACPCALTLAA